MATVSVADDILRDCARALRPVAEYQLEPALDRRLRDLGERKEFLSPEEHAELIDLVAFFRRRLIEKPGARVALRRLNEIAPEVVSGPLLIMAAPTPP